MTQPNALAAITAALSGQAPPTAAAPPVVNPVQLPVNAAPFAFQPAQPFPPAQTQVGPGVAPQNAPNPFQPTPAQAHAMFAAAVPATAQTHAHPSTGVPFAPINPPGEAASAPTVGLDATPVATPPGELPQVVTVPEAPADPAPKAPRMRKPRTAKADAQAVVESMAAEMNATFASVAGDGAAANAAASAAPSDEFDLHAALIGLQSLLPKGCTLTIKGE